MANVILADVSDGFLIFIIFARTNCFIAVDVRQLLT